MSLEFEIGIFGLAFAHLALVGFCFYRSSAVAVDSRINKDTSQYEYVRADPTQCTNVFDHTKRKSYTKLDRSIFDYLKEIGVTKIIEMCAGDGENAELFRENGFDVLAFDLQTLPEKGVEYGIAGSIEDKYPDRMLYLGSAINSQKSVSKFSGRYVLIGGWGEDCTVVTEDVITDLSNPENVKAAQCVSFRTSHEDRMVKVDCRPKYNWMIDNGYVIEKSWVITRDELYDWNSKLYVQQLWIRNDGTNT